MAKEDQSKTSVEFDDFASRYRDLLDQSVAASGESGEYFAGFKAQYVSRILGSDFSGTILDYGCGVGLLTGYLLQSFPQAQVLGFDPSPASIRMASPEVASRAHLTAEETALPPKVDAIILANVMHHVPRAERRSLMAALAERLSPSGLLLIFEHNPANPVTRRAVCRCAFDRDAILLWPREVTGYFRHARLNVLRRDYIVFFPHLLRRLRPMEDLLTWCPLGAQYVLVGTPNGK
jgi:2-polyprenyl-3-methyl-5-hydroxy-6-metoxy-1,4-benzoquinol methylase